MDEGPQWISFVEIPLAYPWLICTSTSTQGLIERDRMERIIDLTSDPLILDNRTLFKNNTNYNSISKKILTPEQT